jgi:heterotetrameric sarcosine oxidase gamma subunit
VAEHRSPAPNPIARSPIARSPIAPGGPRVEAGWEVAAGRSAAPLTLSDRTPLAKVVVRAPAGSATAAALLAVTGRCARPGDGTLVAGSGPGEWTVLGAPGRGPELAERWQAPGGDGGDGLTTAVDLTSARALLRLTGTAADQLLAKVCAIDLDDRVTPDGSAFRSSVAKVVTDVIRDDQAGIRSYLLHCDRSYGRYLFDALLDAGAEFDIEVDGYPEDDPW